MQRKAEKRESRAAGWVAIDQWARKWILLRDIFMSFEGYA